jgi:hypothetical protein
MIDALLHKAKSLRAAKILGIVVGDIASVLAVALLDVWSWVNPGAYKGQIVRAVKQYTGRDLVLQGEVRLTVFPWIALQLGPGSVANPPGFGAAPFASFTRAGTARLAPLMVREFIPHFGTTSVSTQDPKGLSQMSGSAEFSYGAGGLVFDHLRLTVDDTHLQGSLEIPDVDTAAVTFDLAADRIDMDRYLEPREDAPDAHSPPPATPVQDLKASGSLTVGRLQFSGQEFRQARLSVDSQDGAIRVFPLQAQINGGRYAGEIALERRGAPPVLFGTP